ncbi:MAG: all-trans-retinol 13,14-reductase [Limisphaerales bacterium]
MEELTYSYKRKKPEGKFDSIIIGSGLGSLTTASLLAQKGQRVLILEQHYTPGGFTHVFKRKRFEWDVGVHYIGEVHDERTILRRLFDALTDNKLKWEPMGEVYDRIIFGEKIYNFRKSVEAWSADLKKEFPEETDAIDKYLELVFAATKASRDYFAQKAMPDLVSKLVGGKMRNKFYSFSDKITLDVLKSITSNTKLIGVLTGQFGDYGLPPAESSFGMHAMLVKHYFKGGAYPVGGSGQIADTMIPIIQKYGGEVYTNASVAKIAVKNNKATGVIMEDGIEISASRVISGAGAWNTFAKLLPNVKGAEKMKKTVEDIGRSASHISLYIGLDKTSSELNLPKANYWIYPECYDHDLNIKNFMADPEAPLPVCYISFPSAKDPDFENRYPGRSTIEIVSLAPYEWFEKWEDTRWKKRGDEYEAFKDQLKNKLLEQLYRFEPQVKEHIEIAELSTPLSTAHFSGYPQGEIYGLAHSPERFRQADLRPKTDIKNLWLTGQDIVSCGIGGALFSGILTASAITKKNILSDILK